MLAYPALQAETALIATGKQLIDVRSGEGVVTEIWHTYAIIERYTPQLAPAMHAARQQAGEIDFAAINRLHYPLALIAMALLPVIVLLAWRRSLAADIGELAATVTLALLANAFVCGALSNPHDRYGARMVWLASLAVALAACPPSPLRPRHFVRTLVLNQIARSAFTSRRLAAKVSRPG